MRIRIASVRRFKYTSTTYDFMEKYRIFLLFIILIPTPDFPYFYYMLGGNLGSLRYGDVSVMLCLFVRIAPVMRLYRVYLCTIIGVDISIWKAQGVYSYQTIRNKIQSECFLRVLFFILTP